MLQSRSRAGEGDGLGVIDWFGLSVVPKGPFWVILYHSAN